MISTATQVAWDIIAGILKVAFIAIRTLVEITLLPLRALITGVWLGVKAGVDAVWPTISSALSGAFRGIVTAVDTILVPIRAVVGAIWTGIRTTVGVVWPTISSALGGFWTGIKTAAGIAWDGIKAAIWTPVDEAVDKVKALIGGTKGLIGWLKGAWSSIVSGVGEFGGNVLDAVVSAFKGAANKVIEFVNKIFDVINLIPGVTDIKPIKPLAEGGVTGSNIPAAKLARGGAFGMTGGVVNKPMVMMGEEAPRHPEFVIPTNPAYRDRAQMLLGQAAGMIGLRKGGIIGDVLGGVGDLASNIAGIVNHGAGFLLDKLPSTDSLDWLAGTGKWALGQVGDWIKGKVTGFLSGLVGGGGGGKPPTDVGGRFAAMLAQATVMDAQHLPYLYGGGHGSFAGPWDCSGAVSAVLHAAGLLGSPITTDGLKVYGEAGDGKLVTIGVRGSTGRSAHTMMKIGNKYFESGGGHGASWVGGWDGAFPIHRHPPGMATGGMLGPDALDPHSPNFIGWGLRKGGLIGTPFVGSYGSGGHVPADGFAYVHKGETVLSADHAGGPLMHVENMNVYEETDFDKALRRLAWAVETA